MNSKTFQTFTFGPDPFQQPNIKPPQISKLSPFYRISKPNTEQRQRFTKEMKIDKLISTLQKDVQNKENQRVNEYISLNVSNFPKHKRIPTDIALARLETSPNNSQTSCDHQKQKKTFRKLSYNAKQIPQPQLKLNDFSKPSINYKNIAFQLKTMFLRQQELYEIGDKESLTLLNSQFNNLCKQLI